MLNFMFREPKPQTTLNTVSLILNLYDALDIAFSWSLKFHPPAVQTLSLQRAANQKKAGLIVDKLK